jgi:hypothetical protein
MKADQLANAISRRIPMVWAINWTTPQASLTSSLTPNMLLKDSKKMEFAACLICKEGRYLFGKGDHRGWFRQHSTSGPCLSQWNSVCALFNAEPYDAPPSDSSPPDNAADLLAEARRPPHEVIAELKKALADKSKIIQSMAQALAQTQKDCDDRVRVLTANYTKLQDELQVLKSGCRPLNVPGVEAYLEPPKNTLTMEPPASTTISGQTRCQECDEKYMDCTCDDCPQGCEVCYNKIYNCSC